MSKWSRAYKNRLPDTSFLYIEPGGHIDRTGRTKPRAKRHLPVRNRAGTVDLPHLKNALARIPLTDIPTSAKPLARAEAKRLLAREHVLREVDAELLKPYVRNHRRAA